MADGSKSGKSEERPHVCLDKQFLSCRRANVNDEADAVLVYRRGEAIDKFQSFARSGMAH
jgi:hypothetical protein